MTTPHRTAWLNWLAGIVAVMVLVPVLYLLSIGPAWWLTMNGWIPTNIFNAYVTPGYYLMNVGGPVGDSLQSYMFWWHPGPV